jgi:hypothetical protein
MPEFVADFCMYKTQICNFESAMGGIWTLDRRNSYYNTGKCLLINIISIIIHSFHLQAKGLRGEGPVTPATDDPRLLTLIAVGLVACFKPANQPADVDGSYRTCAIHPTSLKTDKCVERLRRKLESNEI